MGDVHHDRINGICSELKMSPNQIRQIIKRYEERNNFLVNNRKELSLSSKGYKLFSKIKTNPGFLYHSPPRCHTGHQRVMVYGVNAEVNEGASRKKVRYMKCMRETLLIDELGWRYLGHNMVYSLGFFGLAWLKTEST